MRMVGGKETTRHVLIDGGNLLYRSYYSYVVAREKSGQAGFKTSGGFPTGLTYGFLSLLGSWLHDFIPISKISIFFDGSPVRRKNLDSTYKSNRTSELKEFVSGNSIRINDKTFENQIDLLKYILGLLGCDIYHDPNEEADDLIASFCDSNKETVRIIVSDDKDFFQLLTDPRIIIYRPGSENRFFDAEAAENHWAKFQGGSHPKVPASHVRMFKSLCGDSSDGIVGVDRLRKKIAVNLCHHMSVEELFGSGLPGFSETEKLKTFELRERIATNFELVGMRSDINMSECITPGVPNFGMASDILVEDLEFSRTDLSGFRSVYKSA